MELNVKLTLKDYTDFNYSYFGRKLKNSLKKFSVFGVVLVVLFAAALISIYLLNERQTAFFIPDSWLVMLILAVLGFVLLFSLLLLVNISLASRYNFQSNKIVQGEYHYTFSNDMFEVLSESVNARITWDKVNGAAFYKNCYAVFISREQAYILPKRCFTDDNQKKYLEELLVQVLPSSKIAK